MSGYELRQIIGRSVGNFWSESYGQIYPMLRRLADEGWIRRRPDEGAGKRARHIHEITTHGREALRDWLCAPATETPPRVELLLKLFFGGEVPLSVTTAHVEAARARTADALDHYRTIAEDLVRDHAGDPQTPFWTLTVEYGLEATRARLEWCDRALDELRRLAESDEDGPRPAEAGWERPENLQPEEKT